MEEILKSCMLTERADNIERVLQGRMGNIVVVLENINHAFNCSAILRTVEGFGIQEVHIIETTTNFRLHKKVTRGCEKWLTLHTSYTSSSECLSALKARGFTLMAGALTKDARNILDIDFSEPRKIGLVFANELRGVSPEARNFIDDYYIIPMSGFSQSFNVNVAVGITLFHMISKHRQDGQVQGDLPVEQKTALRQEWLRKAVRRADKILARFSE
jgi:tRNA (guanosine-2'-O-)-methyltransferase